jgi:hypothetical protein
MLNCVECNVYLTPPPQFKEPQPVIFFDSFKYRLKQAAGILPPPFLLVDYMYFHHEHMFFV